MEHGVETAPEAAAGQEFVPGPVSPPARHWERLAWTAEFLLAMAVAAIVWSEVGGQVHLDMMPWYLKLAPLVAFSWSLVRFTMALVEQPGPWGFRSLRWLAAMLIVGFAMFAITLYYHMHEPVDENDDDEGVTMSMRVPASARSWRFPT